MTIIGNSSVGEWFREAYFFADPHFLLAAVLASEQYYTPRTAGRRRRDEGDSSVIRKSLIAQFAGLALLVMSLTAAHADVTVNPSVSTCSGGVCTQTFDTSTQPLPWQAQAAPLNSTLEDFHLKLFDPSLGTLTGVSATFAFTATITNASLTNTSPNAQSFTFTQTVPLTVSTGGVDPILDSVLAGLTVAPSYSEVISGLASGATVALHGGTPIPPLSAHGSISSSPSLVADLVGPGSETLFGKAITQDQIPNGVTDNSVTDADLTFTVIYDYTPPSVPEPLTAALLGTALLGLFVARRRAR